MSDSLEYDETHPQFGQTLSKPFWVIWMIEFWERFGYYGTQAILALYFVHALGYSARLSFDVFGSFVALAYGFVWMGGWLGDKFLGIKRTMILGAVVLMLAYISLAMASKSTIFYSLSGIIVGNALFKANPSSLISKLYKKGDYALDSAITMYYMAINIGALTSQIITPLIAQKIGWHYAFWISAAGLFVGIVNYFMFHRALYAIGSVVGKAPLNLVRLLTTIVGIIIVITLVAHILSNTVLCTSLVYIVVSIVLMYFLKLAFKEKGAARARMFVAFILILEAVVFQVLYDQMATSLTFYALHNVNRHVLGLTIPAATYQALDAFWIILLSPLLAILYKRVPGTHATKFCFGMTFCGITFAVLWFPQFSTTTGYVSSWWLVLAYFFQAAGELLISALGLSMVAELCPRNISGFAMGVWWLAVMLAGPIGAMVGGLTVPVGSDKLSATGTLVIYSQVFLQIGIATLAIAGLMWLSRPLLNKYIEH